ncbi:C2 domain-containing protein [Pleurostoma richardsiae]|uniref:C2 domain-containing protein n=1 Tax=Pleurostoma richardsiae TaxID=41990 RepID=A0AA38VG51_9PEZI|nr:C2 domain-containing protein [Pleurostoma richardsiae]
MPVADGDATQGSGADGTQAESQPAPTENVSSPPDSHIGQPDDSHKSRDQQEGPPSNGGPIHQLSEIKDKVTDKKQKIIDKTHPPGGYDPTPFPDFPSGYTLKFTFHRATNLPSADLASITSDPYLHATLTAPIPKRHKEDPDLTRRTRTLRKTTEPAWEEEWVVANIPDAGFTLKCRLYDEDYTNHDDRLGNVTVKIPHVDEKWEGFGPEGKWFDVKKRSGSKRAYFFKAIASGLDRHISMTPRLLLGVEVLGKSEGPGAQMYTVGPNTWIKHFSPMIGRLIGTRVNRDEELDGRPSHEPGKKETKKYDFQANELQLSGPVPEKLYHRYVEFRPVIGLMFSSHGLTGKILNKALHKQHRRIYNYDSSTEFGIFEPCSRAASLQFLKMAHFDEGGRIFTYVLTLNGLLRFTETGREFGIDLLSKHTMHSDVATYIACSGEFFIRRLAEPTSSEDPEPREPTHPAQDIPGGPPNEPPPPDPRYYQLIIDNDSGTYRPDKSVLPDLKAFLERNFPGLGVITMHCEDEELSRLKENQLKIKKSEGKMVNMVLNRSPTGSSFSSSDESRLSDIEAADQATAHKSKKELAYEVVEDPSRLKDFLAGPAHKKAASGQDAGETSLPMR